MSQPNNETGAVLARLEERTETLVRDLASIKDTLDRQYVQQHEFRPIRLVVYGMVGIVLVAVLGGLVALVVRSAP